MLTSISKHNSADKYSPTTITPLLWRSIWLALALWVVVVAQSNAQNNPPNVDGDYLRIVYLHKFIDNISWPNLKPGDTLHIGMLINDNTFYDKMKGSAAMFKQYPVVIEPYYSLAEIKPSHLLYVEAIFNSSIPRIWRTIENKNTVLITNDYWRNDLTMINLKYSYISRKLIYTVHEANFTRQGIDLSKEMIVPVLDVAQLKVLLDHYTDTLNIIRKKQKELLTLNEQQRERLDSQKNIIIHHSEDIKKQIDSIRIQTTKLAEQEQLFEKQRYTVQELKKTINAFRAAKEDNSKTLALQQKKVLQQHRELDRQTKKLEEGELRLARQIKDIELKNKKINRLTTDANLYVNKLNTQKLTIYFLVTLIVVIIVFSIYIVITRRRAKKNAETLNILNYDLIQKTEEITSQAEDITKARDEAEIERKKAEDALYELRSTQAHLIQSEKMASIGQLTAGIAHEINNPVNYVNAGIDALDSIVDHLKEYMQSFDSIMADSLENKKQQIEDLKQDYDYDSLIEGLDELTNSIKIGAKRTAEIVRGLRTFSRAGGNTLIRTNIHQAIDATLLMLHHQYKNRINIEKKYGPMQDLACYPERLNQVFMNILANAIQAIEGEGKITIATNLVKKEYRDNKGLWMKISITDTGSGIPEQIRDKIFDPFFTTKEIGTGTGLGLSISYSLIEQHSGFIEVESEVGQGTTFHMYLPYQH